MTLIAAFQCANNIAVLCADSQESWGDYKTSVNKVVPQDIGLYQVAYGGSGLADLVDGIGDAIEFGFETCRATTQRDLQQEIQRILTTFYKSDAVRAFPVDWKDANAAVSGVVCVRVVASGSVFLFKFSRTIVLPVKGFVLRGMEEPIYQHIAQRLYRPALNAVQATSLGLFLFGQAAATSTQISEPTRVVWALPHGMYLDDREEVLQLVSKTVNDIQHAMDELLITCAGINDASDAHIQAQLKTFTTMVIRLRKERSKRINEAFHRQVHPLTRSRPLKEPQ